MDELEAIDLLDQLKTFMKQTNEMILILKTRTDNLQKDIINLDIRIKKLEKDKRIIIT